MKGTTDPREPDDFGGVTDDADLSPASPTPKAISYWEEACHSYLQVLTLEVDIRPARTPDGPSVFPPLMSRSHQNHSCHGDAPSAS